MRSIRRSSWFLGIFLFLTVFTAGSIRVLTAEELVGSLPVSELVTQINAGLERDREEPVGGSVITGATPCVGGMAGVSPVRMWICWHICRWQRLAGGMGARTGVGRIRLAAANSPSWVVAMARPSSKLPTR